MKVENGRVVKATAGRDGGGYFVIVAAEGNCVYIADGKKRRISAPKKKNPKHLIFTSKIIELNDITDKKLRNVLGDYAAYTVTDMGR